MKTFEEIKCAVEKWNPVRLRAEQDQFGNKYTLVCGKHELYCGRQIPSDNLVEAFKILYGGAN